MAGKLKRTLREQQFIAAWIKHNGNAAQAYKETHPDYKGDNARKLGYQIWTKIDISENELLDEIGLTDEYIFNGIKEGTQATKVVSVIPVKPKESQENNPELPDANSKNVEFIDVEDYPTRHKYIDMALKLKSKYPAEKREVDLKGDININAKEQLLSRINSIITRTEKTKSDTGNKKAD